MADQAVAPVEKQVQQVQGRLLLQVALESVLVCWAIALLASFIWFLVWSITSLKEDFTEGFRWGVSGAMLGAATLAGLVLGWLRRPNRVAAALALDEKFALKERVTTLLTLPADQLGTSAGQALVQDVSSQVARLQAAREFPLQLSLRQWLMPAGALALVLLACVLDPLLSKLKLNPFIHADTNSRTVNAEKLNKDLEEIKKVMSQRSEELPPKSDALREMEKEFEKLINQPLDPKNEDKVRERLAEIRKLEDKLKDRLDGLLEKHEKIDAFKKLLERLNADKDKLTKDGPAKDFEDALMKGNLDKAREALEKLIKEMKNDKLDEKQKQQLGEQFKELQEKLQKILDNDDLKKQLQQQLKDGKIDAKQFEKAMERLKDLENLKDIIGDAKDALDKKGTKEAADELAKALDQFNDIQLTEDEIRDLLRDQREIDRALDAFQDALEGDDGDGMGNGGRPGRRRPIDPNDPDSKIRNDRQKAEADAKGIQRVTGYARGGNFNKIPAKAVEGAFRQAEQIAPEAIERQRIPEDAADISRRYFEKLGNQK